MERFVAAVYAELEGDGASAEHLVDALAGDPELAHGVAAEITGRLEKQVAQLWRDGWQPADLARVVDRELGRDEGALIRWVIASESRGYEALGARVARDWMAQLDRIDARSSWDERRPYLLQVADGRADALLAAVHTMAVLVSLPRLPCLVQPPSEWRAGRALRAGSLPDAVLDRVRALLAKAESTSFDAEADACTAKAQELMARHRIDRAVADAAERGREPKPVGRRVGIDDPYADAKVVLLDVVAGANGCHAVWSKDLGFATVFGFVDELDSVEALFTSLLVQVTARLRREGSKRDDFGRSRTKRFRRSFLVAFALRIGERLREAVEITVEAASGGTSVALVPILADRVEATRAAVREAFPDTTAFSPAATDGEGWYAGTVFADQADLARGPELTQRSA